MKKTSLFIFLFMAVFYSCKHAVTSYSVRDSVTKQDQPWTDTTPISPVKKDLKDNIITVTLNNGFILKSTDYDEPNHGQYFEIIHNGKKIFTDTAHAYAFENKLYPVLQKIDSVTFELLIEEDNRPTENLGRLFKIAKDRVVSQVQLPEFYGKEKIGDVIEYNGRWDASELWGDEEKMYTPYNPIIYYKLTPRGFRLDSALTIEGNKKEYGHFYGFDYDEQIGFPIDPNDPNHKMDTVEKHTLKKKK